jgi:hypothetical protein
MVIYAGGLAPRTWQSKRPDELAQSTPNHMIANNKVNKHTRCTYAALSRGSGAQHYLLGQRHLHEMCHGAMQRGMETTGPSFTCETVHDWAGT